MEGLFDKKHIYGNFQDQPDSNRRNQFPLDIETLEALQNNTSLAAAIGNLTGSDKAILCGCNGTPRTEGYVWMKTPRAPITGELLYYPGGGAGSDSDQCHIVEDDSDITIDSTTYAEAYTTRHLANGAGATTYTFGTFAKVTLAGLLDKIQEQHDNIEALKNNAQYTFVRGMILMWSGKGKKTIPNGWVLCDGSTYRINGETIKTPDLRNKFVMGAKELPDGSDELGQILNVGATGGAESSNLEITIAPGNLPAHRHIYTDDSNLYSQAATKCEYVSRPPDDRQGSGDWGASGSGSGGTFLTGSEVYTAQGYRVSPVPIKRTISTMPPYYALAYIMKL